MRLHFKIIKDGNILAGYMLFFRINILCNIHNKNLPIRSQSNKKGGN